jgi:hypothetical protein
LLKEFQKVLSESWEPKASQRERKGTVNNSKWNQNKTNATQMEPKEDQQGVPTDAQVGPKSCLGAFEVLGFVFEGLWVRSCAGGWLAGQLAVALAVANAVVVVAMSVAVAVAVVVAGCGCGCGCGCCCGCGYGCGGCD